MTPKSIALALLFAAPWAPGCEKDEPPTVGNGPLLVLDAAPPRDHLGPGELLEGDVRAFGMILPRGMKVESSFPLELVATGDAKPADVANYIRSRVSSGTVKVGAASTMFELVQVPVRPGRELVIRVEEGNSGRGTRVTFRDVTPPPLEPNLTEEQRWRQAGMRGPGQPEDPTHLH